MRSCPRRVGALAGAGQRRNRRGAAARLLTANGFALAIEQPTLGIMETDWAENRAGVPQTELAKYFDKYFSFLSDTYRRDKFRSRMERP